MTQSSAKLHPSEPGYDPVLDGVSRGLEALFPLIHNPTREEADAENQANLSEAEEDGNDPI